MAKISMPEHMRRLAAAITFIRESTESDFLEIHNYESRGTAIWRVSVFIDDRAVSAVSTDMLEAALKLLHKVAGTDLPPF